MPDEPPDTTRHSTPRPAPGSGPGVRREQIRACTPEDFDEIARLTNHFITHTCVHFGYTPVTADELRQTWEAARGRYPWLVLELQDGFAGFTKAGVWRAREAYQWTAEAGIYLDQRAQGRGHGSRLYAALIDELRLAGFQSVIGGITLPNPASVRLHEALGFTPVGTFRRAGFKFGQWHDVGFWQLPLRGAEPPCASGPASPGPDRVHQG